MALKDGIENYQQLHEAVIDQTQSTLRLDIGPFSVPDSIRKNTNITVTGDLSGYMRAAASLNGHVRNYAFAWNASQNKGPDGTDAIHAENPSTPIISGTIIVKDRETESETRQNRKRSRGQSRKQNPPHLRRKALLLLRKHPRRMLRQVIRHRLQSGSVSLRRQLFLLLSL